MPEAEEKSQDQVLAQQRAPSPSPLQQIRTFQGDVAKALAKQKESLFSIKQTEDLKKSSGANVSQPEPQSGREKFILLFVGSIVLLAAAGFGGWYTYQEVVKKTTPPTFAVPESRFISAERSVNVDLSALSAEALFTKLSSESAGAPLATLTHFVLRDGPGSPAPLSTITKFSTKLETRAPGSLLRALKPVFMLGALGESRFLILKLSSFENAFAGMLLWEESMAADLDDLFSTAPLLKTIASTSVFKDVISRNKDARVLFVEIPEGGQKPALLYSFFDNEILIITDRLETLQTLIDRLTREKLSR